jgi:hypothetical protein
VRWVGYITPTNLMLGKEKRHEKLKGDKSRAAVDKHVGYSVLGTRSWCRRSLLHRMLQRCRMVPTTPQYLPSRAIAPGLAQ